MPISTYFKRIAARASGERAPALKGGARIDALAAGARSVALATAASLVLFALVAVPASALAGAPVPTQAESDAYERGRASARTVLVFQYPHICAIVLERPRCARDLDAFLGRYPRFPAADASALRSAFASGDFTSIDPHYREVHSAFVAETERVANPHAAWFVEAGIASVEIPAARTMLQQTLAAPNAISLARNAAVAGDFRAVVPATALAEVALATPIPQPSDGRIVPLGISQDEIGPYEAAVASNLQASFPVQAYPHIVYADGPRGDAQLGVAIGTLLELAELPRVLAQPDAQAFVDATFKRLIVTLPGDAARVQALRAAFASSADLENVYKPGGPVAQFVAFERDLDRASLHALLLGQFGAQIGYNAVVFRDPKLGAEFRNQVGTFDEADGAVPGLAALRAAVRGAGSSDWSKQNAAAVALVARIVGP